MDTKTVKTIIQVVMDERIADLKAIGKTGEAEMAEEALELAMQIIATDEPKAPAINMNFGIRGITKQGVPYSMCPKCGALVSPNTNDGFCGHCGQAIKWEDDEQ